MSITMSEELARALFGVIWIGFAFMRIYFHGRAGKEQRPLVSAWEGRAFAVVRVVVGLPMLFVLMAYVFWPAPLAWAGLELPASLRWLGAGSMLAGAMLVFWINATLDRNFSGTLALRDDHELVVKGPYRFVRHPMYSAFVVLIAGMGLLSANWLVAAPAFVTVAIVMLVRTPKEEAMLLDRFGDRYRDYMARTGRFLPHFGG